MIAVDSSVLVHAHRSDSPWHAKSENCVRQLCEGKAPWALLWPSVHEFLGVVTHAEMFLPPSSAPQALEQVDAWLESPSVVLLGPELDHWKSVRQAWLTAHAAGPMSVNAGIAALCAQHGVRELWAIGRDLSAFGVRIRNPAL